MYYVEIGIFITTVVIGYYWLRKKNNDLIEINDQFQDI